MLGFGPQKPEALWPEAFGGLPRAPVARLHTIPYHTIPDQTRPDQTRPDQTRPDQTRPDQTRPDQTRPDQTRPDQTRPYHTIPYHTIPYHTIPYHTIPYHTIPYHTVDDRNPASPHICIYVLYYHTSDAFGIKGLYKVTQDFYHQQYHAIPRVSSYLMIHELKP